jgi:hypothetical protein
VGGVLAAASAVSLVYLGGRYQEAAPHRAAMAVERERQASIRTAEEERRTAELREREAAADLRGDNGQEAADRALVELARNPDFPVTVAPGVPAAPRKSEPARRPTTYALRWATRPNWQVRVADIPESMPTAGVRFRCTVQTDGSLTGCSTTEIPAGSGLAARLLPFLDDARMEPVIEDGRAIRTQATFSVSFDRPPPRPRPSMEVTPDRMPETSNGGSKPDGPTAPAPPPGRTGPEPGAMPMPSPDATIPPPAPVG